jgi:hypothetical protein
MEDGMNRHESGDPLEWETVAGGSTPFLHHSDTAFDLRNMLVAAGQVEPGATGQGLGQGFERWEFPVGMDCGYAVAAVEIILVDLLEGLEKLGYGSVRKVVDCRET